MRCSRAPTVGHRYLEPSPYTTPTPPPTPLLHHSYTTLYTTPNQFKGYIHGTFTPGWCNLWECNTGDE